MITLLTQSFIASRNARFSRLLTKEMGTKHKTCPINDNILQWQNVKTLKFMRLSQRQVSHLILLCLLKKKWCSRTKHFLKCIKST